MAPHPGETLAVPGSGADCEPGAGYEIRTTPSGTECEHTRKTAILEGVARSTGAAVPDCPASVRLAGRPPDDLPYTERGPAELWRFRPAADRSVPPGTLGHDHVDPPVRQVNGATPGEHPSAELERNGFVAEHDGSSFFRYSAPEHVVSAEDDPGSERLWAMASAVDAVGRAAVVGASADAGAEGHDAVLAAQGAVNFVVDAGFALAVIREGDPEPLWVIRAGRGADRRRVRWAARPAR